MTLPVQFASYMSLHEVISPTSNAFKLFRCVRAFFASNIKINMSEASKPISACCFWQSIVAVSLNKDSVFQLQIFFNISIKFLTNINFLVRNSTYLPPNTKKLFTLWWNEYQACLWYLLIDGLSSKTTRTQCCYKTARTYYSSSPEVKSWQIIYKKNPRFMPPNEIRLIILSQFRYFKKSS